MYEKTKNISKEDEEKTKESLLSVLFFFSVLVDELKSNINKEIPVNETKIHNERTKNFKYSSKYIRIKKMPKQN